MSKLKLIGISCMLALLALPGPAVAQYMYLDVDGDSLNTSSDQLSPNGATVLTIYLNTNHDRDGSAQVCNSHTGAPADSGLLNVFGYTIVLHAQDGTVSWGSFTPADPAYAALGSDLTDDHDAEFNRLRPAGTYTAPGLVALGSISLTVLSGTPAISIATSTPLDPFGFGSGFATSCHGSEFHNTYVLGTDWFDTDGVLPPTGSGNSAPMAAVPPSIDIRGGEPVQISGNFQDPDTEDTLEVSVSGLPGGLSSIMGRNAGGAVQVRIYGIANNEGTVDSTYELTWSYTDQVSSGGASSTLKVLPAAANIEIDRTVTDYVTATHSHGMSPSTVRSFGAAALPTLSRILRDDSLRKHWHKAVAAIGFIGDTTYFDTLRTFVWERFHGPLNKDAFQSVLQAQASMGVMATMSPRVLDYLDNTSTESAWSNIPWSSSRSSQQTADWLVQMTMASLSHTDSERAAAIIDRVVNQPQDKRHRDRNNGFKRVNDSVRASGLEGAWIKEGSSRWSR